MPRATATAARVRTVDEAAAAAAALVVASTTWADASTARRPTWLPCVSTVQYRATWAAPAAATRHQAAAQDGGGGGGMAIVVGDGDTTLYDTTICYDTSRGTFVGHVCTGGR